MIKKAGANKIFTGNENEKGHNINACSTFILFWLARDSKLKLSNYTLNSLVNLRFGQGFWNSKCFENKL
ncbi:hypothetical protein CWB97_21940, partial [Pseudoalteromonas citrea]